MRNGASTGQGGNPAHGKRDVRQAADSEQHDRSQLAEAPITHMLLATVKSYTRPLRQMRWNSVCNA